MRWYSKGKGVFVFFIAFTFFFSAIYFSFPSCNVVDLDDYFFAIASDEKNSGHILNLHSLLNSKYSLLNSLLVFQRFLVIVNPFLTICSNFQSVLSCRSPPLSSF